MSTAGIANKWSLAAGRALPSASKSGVQGREPKAPGEVSNSWGRRAQHQSPLLSPLHRPAAANSPPQRRTPAGSAAAKPEDCLPSQFRYLTERAQDGPRAAWKTSKTEQKTQTSLRGSPGPLTGPPAWIWHPPFTLDVSTTPGSSFLTINGLDPREGITLKRIQHKTSKIFFCKYMPALGTKVVTPVFPATQATARGSQRCSRGPERHLQPLALMTPRKYIRCT